MMLVQEDSNEEVKINVEEWCCEKIHDLPQYLSGCES